MIFLDLSTFHQICFSKIYSIEVILKNVLEFEYFGKTHKPRFKYLPNHILFQNYTRNVKDLSTCLTRKVVPIQTIYYVVIMYIDQPQADLMLNLNLFSEFLSLLYIKRTDGQKMASS